MARGRRGGPDLSRLTPYERRVFRRIGMLPDQAKARGISLAAARGHAPRRIETGGERIPEHKLRDIRRRERGDPTEAERRFLRAQAKRSGVSYDDLRARFMQYSQSKRDLVRERQASAARRYRASKGRFRWATDAPSGWGDAPTGYEGAGGSGGAGGMGGGGGGGDAGGDLDEDNLNYDRYAEFVGDWDDFPDFEEIDGAFLFYH